MTTEEPVKPTVVQPPVVQAAIVQGAVVGQPVGVPNQYATPPQYGMAGNGTPAHYWQQQDHQMMQTQWIGYAIGWGLCMCCGPCGGIVWIVMFIMYCQKPQQEKEHLKQSKCAANTNCATCVCCTIWSILVIVLWSVIAASAAGEVETEAEHCRNQAETTTGPEGQEDTTYPIRDDQDCISELEIKDETSHCYCYEGESYGRRRAQSEERRLRNSVVRRLKNITYYRPLTLDSLPYLNELTHDE
jgi:hypothetical protein